MGYFKNLKTSDKISASFSLFNVFSLIILLFSINIIYFYIWYSGIEQQSLYNMNVNYNSYTDGMNRTNKEAFVDYILKQDTIIIAAGSDKVVCSEWVAQKIHRNPEKLKELQQSFFYPIGDKIYFIFSRKYDDIWEVKILYDTTAYFNSQIIIIKVSLVIILVFLILNYIFGKIISRIVLKKLTTIAQYAKGLNLDDEKGKIDIEWPKDDEIKILADTLNDAFKKISCQSKNQKQFIVDVSHEFKTPLMVMNSKIDLYQKVIEKKKESRETIDDLLNSMKWQTKKLNKLLETMFYISRVEDGIVDIVTDQIPLNQFTKELVDDIVTTSKKDVQVNVDIADDILLKTDVASLNIVIENLVTNAIKFSSEDIRIDISFKDAILSITDHGEGIPADKLEKIWEKFTRFDTKIEWFGVGLFLVKRIAYLHSWEIDVESEVGSGTTFKIKF